jgi:membrane protease subunit HflK
MNQRPTTPADIEFLIRHYWRQYRGQIVTALVVLVVLLAGSSLFYAVDADSEGVVLRLGKYVRTSLPGLHMKLPYPIEVVYEVPVQRIQSLEFGFATAEPGRVTRYAPNSSEQDKIAQMLTGDLNLAHVEWVVQYRVKDPYNYLFKIGGSGREGIAVADTIRDASEAVMRKLVGDASVDEVITIGREQIAGEAKVEIQQLLDGFEAGVEVVTVKLQSATPPDPVKDAWNEVNRARQNKERVVNEALGERNRQIPAARGQKDRTISEAEGYRERVVREMTGRANAFLKQLAEYEKAPEVTRTRLYLEAMEEILAAVQDKVIIDESVRGVLPLLNLDAAALGGAVKKGGAQ